MESVPLFLCFCKSRVCVCWHDPPSFFFGPERERVRDGWTKSDRQFVGLRFAPTVYHGEHRLQTGLHYRCLPSGVFEWVVGLCCVQRARASPVPSHEKKMCFLRRGLLFILSYKKNQTLKNQLAIVCDPLSPACSALTNHWISL